MMLRGFWLILSLWIFHMTKSEQTAYKVGVCPQSKAAWQKASKRINCSEDNTDPTNRYHCLPDVNLTTLMEFCYNQSRVQVVKGLCLVFLERKNIVSHYNCSKFQEGCPNAVHYADEMYKFPACVEIDPIQHCYKAEPSCQQKPPLLPVVEDTDNSTSFNASILEENKKENNTPVVLPLTFGCLVLIICIVVSWKIRKIIRRCLGPKENNTEDEIRCLLKPGQLEKLEEIEADIKKMKIDYLLQEMPSDKKLLSLIAKSLKIPQEILYWSLQDRRKFVSSMKNGMLSVYNGRGMVIGCTEAGKTTLVKKLKGESNLNTESTSGIEIHTHVFKLNTEESTITNCAKQERKKGCVCLTPITLNKSKENLKNEEEKLHFDVSEAEKGVSNNSSVISQIPIQLSLNNESNDGMNNETYDGMNNKTYDGMNNKTYDGINNELIDGINNELFDRKFPSNSLINEECADVDVEERTSVSSLEIQDLLLEMDLSQEVKESNIESEHTIDFSGCTASVNTKNLKMLSLLDFAGHSAYYACHHIFFSPRAFFILVVDMTKELKSVATKACPNEYLIYSNWTYEDYIRYWLGSIHTYSSKTAPVILVASHAEGYNGDPTKARQFYLKVLKCLPKVLKNHLDKDRVLLIEKDTNTNMEVLRKCIASLVKSQSHWGENIPIAWAKLESVLKKLQEGCKIYSFNLLLDGVQKTNDLSISNEEELINALTFFHETGVILFRSEIKHIIILDVQWFVNALKCIILETDHLHITDKRNLEKFQQLNEYGLLSSNLLNILWKKDNFNQHRDVLINHLKQLDILAGLSEDKWYVPCMNKQKYSGEILTNCDVSSTLCFLFEFLPFVVFHRLIVACINKLKMEPWKRLDKMCIFHTVTILTCMDQKHRLLMGICNSNDADYPYSIEIQTNVTNPRKVDNQLSSNLKREICKILTDLTQAFSSCERSFKVGYRCHVRPFSEDPEDNIIKEEDIRASELDCSKCPDNHIVNVRSILRFWEENTDADYPDFKEGSKRYLEDSKKVDKYFVETEAYQRGQDIFHKYGIVIWTGRPGCGKTKAAIHLILKQLNNEDKNCTFRMIRFFEELSYIEQNKKTLILIDNFFFQQLMDSVKNWWEQLERLHRNCFQNNEIELGKNRVRVIITAREHVIERACYFMDKTTPILNENFRINANFLTEDEKDKIFSKQCEFAKVERNLREPVTDGNFHRIINKANGPIGFPLCAHLFACSAEYQNSGSKFFSHPIEYLKHKIQEEIEMNTSHQTELLFLVLFFHERQRKLGRSEKLEIDNVRKCQRILEENAKYLVKNLNPLELRGLEYEAQRFVGSFVKEETNGSYKFVHDSVYEAVGAFLSETYVTGTANSFSLDILQNQNCQRK